MTDISFIIVNWNTRELLKNCLASVVQTAGEIKYEVIVVDNASEDGSIAMLHDLFPQVKIIANDRNRGFGAANNQAFQIMKGRYALLLNTDTVLTSNAVRELFSFLENHPEAGMCCGQLLNRDGSKQNSIAAFPTLFTLLMNMTVLEYVFPRKYPSKRFAQRQPVAVDSGIGACLLVRKEAMDAVGWFDERYYFFFEETDWAYRMHLAGWKIYHVPGAQIYHFQGQSIGPDIRSRIEFYRSRYQFFKKWHSFPYYCLIRLIIFGRLLVNCLFTALTVILSLGIARSARNKLLVYAYLIGWHLNPSSRQGS